MVSSPCFWTVRSPWSSCWDCLRGVSARQCQCTLPTVDTANRPWPISVAPQQGSPRSGSAWLGRFQKDGLPSCRGESCAVQGHQLAHRGGAAWSLPLLIGGGNGRQVARPRFALLPVAVLRSLRLGGGSRHFWLGVFCPRYSRDARRGLWAAALTSATQRKAPPSWWGNGAEVRMLAEGSEGQRRTFRAEPMRTAANWFRLPEKKNPAPRPLACGVSSNTPALPHGSAWP